MVSDERFAYKRLVRELKLMHGRNTELVSVYVPSGQSLNIAISQLLQEQGTASNIKSKATMKNVTAALEKAVQHLRLFEETPKNGLAVFSGNVSENEGVMDVRVWSCELPELSTKRLYRCEKGFILEPLEEMLEDREVYGLIVMDNREATIALLSGEQIIVKERMSSGYHGKHNAGGWSQARYRRIIENESQTFKAKIGEHASKVFLSVKNLRGILVGGCAMTKDDLPDFLHHELRKIVLTVQDTGYTDEQGLKELVGKSAAVLKDSQAMRQKASFQRFMQELVAEGKYAFGIDVDAHMEDSSIETILLSDKLEGIDDLIERIKGKAAIEVLSTDFEEGNQLWMAFGGKAAILRYKG
jgi:peptide chain release factor subunit 1